ncbi:NfeD family protein [Brevundimonas aveniformis]|uniref:NfeD family protein n=1 Tax=Brevundimonas aveniformis TaxID=370977 RepID=UPI0003F6DC1E|nr:NfeD family protein [Brevundimonas aveniformis]
MDAVLALYQSQPFWLWLVVGCLILAIEAASGTEWLLWPAVSAGIVAIVTLLAPNMGLPIEVVIFAVLTLATTLASRRLIRRVNPDGPDINDRARSLIGARAEVTHPFVDGRGRVTVSGSEWLADIEGDAPPVGGSVTVEAVDGSRLRVKP